MLSMPAAVHGETDGVRAGAHDHSIAQSRSRQRLQGPLYPNHSSQAVLTLRTLQVYWSNAVQIIPPHDAGIAATIEASLEVEGAAWVPFIDTWEGTKDMKEDYFKMVAGLVEDKT